MSYAETTRVPIERSRAEIERTLDRYGVDNFFFGKGRGGSGIGFTYKDRMIKLSVPLPERNKYRNNQTGEGDWKREHRRLWRVLLLWLKANLELVDAGLIDFEDAFLAQTCLTDGKTVSETLQPQIEAMLETGKIPKLLIGSQE